jgi:TolB-like protein
LLVAHLTDAVTAELARTRRVSVASRTTASGYAGKPVREVAEALQVDFVLESSAVVTGDIVHVVARVVDARTDRKVWVGEYDVSRSEIASRARGIATEALSGTLDYISRGQP